MQSLLLVRPTKPLVVRSTAHARHSEGAVAPSLAEYVFCGQAKHFEEPSISLYKPLIKLHRVDRGHGIQRLKKE
tara:strand:+ start:544 stop:765 length:222 start_codon:yes stop_codon:yes gene_type:complete